MNSAKKDTVLWIGEGMLCSVKDGMSWHFDIPEYKLSDLLGKKFDLIKGRVEDWKIESNNLYHKNNAITQKFLSSRVLGAVFYHKNLSEDKLKISKEIFIFLEENFSNIRLLNSPIKSKLFSSKIEFSKYVSKLTNANSIIPEWKTLKTENDLCEVIDSFGFPFLIKPDSLSNGKGIIKIKNKRKSLKTLRDSKKGVYHKNIFGMLKSQAKSILKSNENVGAKNKPLKLIANEFINTFSPKYNCYINSTIYYWNGKLNFADVRVSHNGFNIHANDSSNSSLTIKEYSEICNHVFGLIKKESKNMNEIIENLHQHSIRLDCLIDIESEQLKVAEAEIKGGPTKMVQNHIMPLMNKVGWDERNVRDYLNGEPCRINNLFDHKKT